ncbi:putative leucine-rich repeat-containing protein DDB_G0290503 [Pseudochaenichthys georgianus]|uniref:putative leucine-rich repeat-containing protein DDB_G0290503 n=1 Tax=Pseudochaenichthys georgianus TaxID=52239 RepID=UPI0039C0E1FB
MAAKWQRRSQLASSAGEEDNAKLTMKNDSTSENLEVLKGLQTLFKTEMEAKINQMKEDFDKEKTTCLGTELLVAQSHIDHLIEENAKLTMKDDSTSEAFKELMGLQTQAKMEKEEMEAKINEMEEDFKKEKTSLRTELSDAQSLIDRLKEEYAKLTMKDDSTSENLEELMGLQTQAKTEMEAKVNQMEEDFDKEKTCLRTELSVLQSHIDHLKEENAKLTMKDDSTSEAFEELKGLQTQAKMEKEEMVAKLHEVEEDLTKEKISLRTELSVAQSHIDHLKEDNAKLTMKNDSTSENLKVLKGLQTLFKTEMEAKINQMKEDFDKEKTTWSDLSCQRLEEISSLGTELLVAQSHIDHLIEENAKLTMKDDSTSEAFKELMGLQTQAKMEKEEMEAKINEMEEDFKKEKTSLRTELSDAQSLIDRLKEEYAKLTMKDDSTSENLEELMGLQTQAKTEMEAKVNQMEEDFDKEKNMLEDGAVGSSVTHRPT